MIERIPASAVTLRPDLFQFKSADAKGDNGALRGVTKWVEAFAAIMIVWQDASGEYIAVDGHQRKNLADRLEAQGHPAILFNAEVVKESDGFTADHALLMALAANIAQGSESTRAYDVARVLRRKGENLAFLDGLVPPRRKSLDTAKRLCGLAEDAFGYAYRCDLPEEWAALIADEITGDAEQMAVVRFIDENRPLSEAEARLLIEQAKAVGFNTSEEDTLFGLNIEATSRMKDRAAILARACSNLRTRKAELATVTNRSRSKRLESLGNKLAHTRNKAALERVQTVMASVKKRAIVTGPVSDLLNQAVDKFQGGANVNQAADWLIDEVLDNQELLMAA